MSVGHEWRRFRPGDRVRVRLNWECPLAHDGETPSHLPEGHHVALSGACGTVERNISPDVGWVGHRVVVRLDGVRSPAGTQMYAAAELERSEEGVGMSKSIYAHC